MITVLIIILVLLYVNYKFKQLNKFYLLLISIFVVE